LLDEPTTGVDAVSRREFWDLLGRLKQAGLTTVVSTPYMDEATRCDRIALMHRGHLLGVDTPEAITRAYERPLLGVRAIDRYRALLALRKYEHAHSAYPFGDVIHYTDTRSSASIDAIARDVKTFLSASGFVDASAEPLTPTVEDSFIARTEDAA
jgi:ABC-type multidrug transport system ATPase subunit